MKIRLLIIIGIIIGGIIIASIFGYVMYKQSVCTSMPGYLHNPRPNSIWDCLQYDDENNTSKTQYQIPANVYEIWQSNGIIIHGMVGKNTDNIPVMIKVEEEQGNLIEVVQITPDDSVTSCFDCKNPNTQQYFGISHHS